MQKSNRRTNKRRTMTVKPMIKQLKSYGYTFNYKCLGGYYIIGFSANEYNLHIRFKKLPLMKFGIWKIGNKYEYFAEHINYIDKFKPTRCEYEWNTLEEMMDFVSKCINDEKYYQKSILDTYEDESWEEHLKHIERTNFRDKHNYLNREEFFESYYKFKEIIKNLDTNKFMVMWGTSENCFRLYDVWFYTTNEATTDDHNTLFRALMDCNCTPYPWQRVPFDYWEKKRRISYSFKTHASFRELCINKKLYLKTLNFPKYKKIK